MQLRQKVASSETAALRHRTSSDAILAPQFTIGHTRVNFVGVFRVGASRVPCRTVFRHWEDFRTGAFLAVGFHTKMIFRWQRVLVEVF